jgi:hypothetical protein
MPLLRRHAGSAAAADEHFSRKLSEVFAKAGRHASPMAWSGCLVRVVDGPVAGRRCGPSAERRSLGAAPDPPLIDALYRAMALWKDERRADLVRYLAEHGLFEDTRVWKLAQALIEILSRASEYCKLVSARLAERETLRAEAR